MPVCKENYLSGFGRDEFGACRAPDYSAPQSWSCFLMCSCGAPFHPLQSACVAGGELTPEVIPDIWNSFFGCYPVDTAAVQGLVPLAG